MGPESLGTLAQAKLGIVALIQKEIFRTRHYEAESRFSEDLNMDSRVSIKEKQDAQKQIQHT